MFVQCCLGGEHLHELHVDFRLFPNSLPITTQTSLSNTEISNSADVAVCVYSMSSQQASSHTPPDHGDDAPVDAEAAAVGFDNSKFFMVTQQKNGPRDGVNETLTLMAKQNAAEQASGQQAAVGSITTRPEHNTKSTPPYPPCVSQSLLWHAARMTPRSST